MLGVLRGQCLLEGARKTVRWISQSSIQHDGALNAENLKICIVGSGPAGFYVADKISKRVQGCSIDMLEALPSPYGLVRSGVAPDHPDTKNVIHHFEDMMEKGTLKFFGNVRVGNDGAVTLPQLRDMYHAVVLAYGAASGKRLSVPGSSLQNVMSARDFVNWYNGHPSGSIFDEMLVKDVQDVVICGLGNVALDCARILLKDPEADLHPTDISTRAVEALKKSNVRNVHILARRGPAQAACTPKELRELLGLQDVGVLIHPPGCLELSETCTAEIKGSRIHKRVVEVLKKHSGGEGDHHCSKRVHLHFLARPAEYVKGEDDRVGTTVVENMVLEKGETGQRAVGTGDMFSLNSQLVIESVGYQAEPIDGAPFDAKTGTIPNVLGRVIEDSNQNNLYVCGWLKRGPSGIIGTNLVDAEQTVDTMVRHQDDWGSATGDEKKGRDGLLSILKKNHFISFEDWKKIDAEEVAQGTSIGKVREKFTDQDTMIQIAHASLK